MARPPRIKPPRDADELTTEEAAALLGVNRATLFRYLKDPRYSTMPRPEGHKGVPLRWSRSALLAWAEASGWSRQPDPEDR